MQANILYLVCVPCADRLRGCLNEGNDPIESAFLVILGRDHSALPIESVIDFATLLDECKRYLHSILCVHRWTQPVRLG